MAGRLGLAWVVAAAACGGGGSGGGVERQIEIGLEKKLGVPVERVRCPAGPYPKRCAVEVTRSPAIEVQVVERNDGAGGLDWSIDGFVISTAPLAAEIAIELDDLGVEAAVDCGPAYVTTEVGQRIACTLDLGGGVRGAAWARIVDDEARFALELALDPAAVAARTTEVDPAELERLSRALDVDDPFDAPAGDAGPRDGGVPDAPPGAPP
jgi:hypothetical protein